MDRMIKRVLPALLVMSIVLSTGFYFFVTDNSRWYALWDLPFVMVVDVLLVYYLIYVKIKPSQSKKIATLAIGTMYLLSFNYIYIVCSEDKYFILFMIIKELILIFIVGALYFLRKPKEQSDKMKVYRIVSMIVYILSIFTFVSLLVEHLAQYEASLFLHFGSMLAFLGMQYYDKRADIEIESRVPEKMIVSPVNVDDEFIYANYVYGLPEDEELKDNLCVVINDEVKRELVVCVFGDEDAMHRLEYSRIKRIEIWLGTYESEKKKDESETEFEKQIMMGKVLNILSPQAASEEFQKRATLYLEAKPRAVMHMDIVYEIKKEERSFHIYTKHDYKMFFETLEKTLPFPIVKLTDEIK